MSQRLSPDGMYYWDGTAWVSTLSPDGRHRWNGEAWVAFATAPVYAPPTRVVREPTAWTRPLQVALAAWFALGAGFALTLPFWMGGFMTQVMNQSIQQQQQLNPEATPLPTDFTDAMTATMNGVLWFAAFFTVALYAAGLFGVLKRWTWLYYAILGLFGLGLIGLPLNLVNVVTGQTVTGGLALHMPSLFLYSGIAFGVIQAGLFIWMLVALTRYGPWAMRRIS